MIIYKQLIFNSYLNLQKMQKLEKKLKKRTPNKILVDKNENLKLKTPELILSKIDTSL